MSDFICKVALGGEGQVDKELNIVDVGCGKGYLSLEVAQKLAGQKHAIYLVDG